MPSSKIPLCQTCQWFQEKKSECWLEPARQQIIPNPSTIEPPKPTWIRTKVVDPKTEYCSHQEDKQ